MVQLAACSTATERAPRSSGRVYTAEQIARWNTADAFGVIERIGFTIVENDRGQVSLRQRRGRSSINGSGADRPVLVLDNTILSDANLLRQLRASSIQRVEVLGPGDATGRFGTGSAAGAVLIFTR